MQDGPLYEAQVAILSLSGPALLQFWPSLQVPLNPKHYPWSTVYAWFYLTQRIDQVILESQLIVYCY